MSRFSAVTFALAAILGLTSQMHAFANYLRNEPLEKKISLSDIVFIGRAVSNNIEDSSSERFSLVEVGTVLKGSPPKTLQVLIQGMIAEQNPNCCSPGKIYLFFLKHLSGNKYQSVNGPFGIYPMDAQDSRTP
jgi:hypothetical protein